MCGYYLNDDVDDLDTRGRVMRHGYCQQLQPKDTNCKMRGRAAFARSAGSNRRNSELSIKRCSFASEQHALERHSRKERSTFQTYRKCSGAKHGRGFLEDSVLDLFEIEEHAWFVTANVLSEIAATKKRQPKLWEQAELRASEAAREYATTNGLVDSARPGKLERGAGQQKESPESSAPRALSSAVPFSEPPAGGGAPMYASRHYDSLTDFAFQGKNGRPNCWTGSARCQRSQYQLQEESSEYRAVTGYLQDTLTQGVIIEDCMRLQNQAVYSQYSAQGDETIMFHGCRTAHNESNIIQNGFQVSACVSGGRGFGTWFAYRAHYSNGGYAYPERLANGTIAKHLFVCVVSYKHTVKDDSVMRVVGQGCAYPLWLVRYRETSTRARSRRHSLSSPQRFFIVHDGQWVLEKSK